MQHAFKNKCVYDSKVEKPLQHFTTHINESEGEITQKTKPINNINQLHLIICNRVNLSSLK